MLKRLVGAAACSARFNKSHADLANYADKKEKLRIAKAVN